MSSKKSLIELGLYKKNNEAHNNKGGAPNSKHNHTHPSDCTPVPDNTPRWKRKKKQFQDNGSYLTPVPDNTPRWKKKKKKRNRSDLTSIPDNTPRWRKEKQNTVNHEEKEKRKSTF